MEGKVGLGVVRSASEQVKSVVLKGECGTGSGEAESAVKTIIFEPGHLDVVI